MSSQIKTPKKTIETTNNKTKLFDISIIFFIFSVLIIPNITYKMALDRHLDVRYLTLSVFMLILTLLFVSSNSSTVKKTDFSILKTPVILAYFAYFVLVTLSSLWATNFSEASYEFLKTGAFFFMFIYIILFIAPKEKSKDAVITTFVALGLILALIGFSQISKTIDELGFSLKSVYKVIGNNAHKNIYSQVLFITFSFSIYGIYYFKDFRQKLSILISFTNLLIILLLMTRSVWGALLISTIATLIVYFIFLRKSVPFKKIKKVIIPLVIIAIFSGVIFLLISGLDSKKEVRTHISETSHLDEGNALHRIVLWKKSFELLKESPLLGVGAGNWKIDILKYDVTKSNKKGHIEPRRPHNDYVSVITETGIIGFIIYISIFIMIVFEAIKLMKIIDKEEDKIFMLTLFFALIGYLTYSFFSFPKERIETQIFLNTIMAFIVYKYYSFTKSKNEEKKQTTKLTLVKPAAVFIAIFLIVAVKSGYDRVKAEVNVNKIYSLRNTTDFNKVYELAGNSITPFARISPFSEPFYKIQGAMLYQQQADSATTVEKYQLALKEIPYHVKTLLELAQVYVTAKDFDKAVEYSTLAYAYAPSNIRVQVVHAYFLKEAGRFDEGYQVLRTINPSKKFDKYVAVRDNYLNYMTLKLYNSTSNLKVKNILNRKIQKPAVLNNLYIETFSNNHSFEQTLMTQVLNQINKNDTLIINDTSISNIINKYNINLDSLNVQ
ncbi:MAG: O-antigen ligase family protein [Bacteroidales bacterium]|nr:O-antigen ligase family protein [Bacteroidales bacterium]